MYSEGKGIEKDESKSKEWYKKSEENKDIDPQYNLGIMYSNDEIKDYSQAIKLFEMSAKEGNPNAYYHLGIAYYNGKGIRQNHERGFEMFKKSLNQKEKLEKAYFYKLCIEFPTVCSDTK